MDNNKTHLQVVETIGEIVKQFISTDINEKIEVDCNLQETYNLGSIDIIQIILKIEQLFNIEFSEEYLTLENIHSINAIASTVENIQSSNFTYFE